MLSWTADVGVDRRRLCIGFLVRCDVRRGEIPFCSYCTAAQSAAAVFDTYVWMVFSLLIYYLAESCFSLFLVALCDGFSPSSHSLLLCTTPSYGRSMPMLRHLSRRTGAKCV
eukprot:TRINITY_DN908_c0_g1_i2.p4 TRINITY_DN908_c0_g1~~TRINITY_DN908_c0_g1_i2.p4  ORF type:complete len:112 (-),score=5.86 TRINITY_DN908_c0_g1_i2:694-1029(-)